LRDHERKENCNISKLMRLEKGGKERRRDKMEKKVAPDRKCGKWGVPAGQKKKKRNDTVETRKGYSQRKAFKRLYSISNRRATNKNCSAPDHSGPGFNEMKYRGTVDG